ncbi:RagB/SusD family nutrient uptake outer membrane protein [Sphingobacterium thalpophilum]|uniref:RagB/SusD family nutrient uptake outer membrane protein n=1 Tax=Sphingobacterium thalpophilum TaxID=259 RepID=UPI0037D9ED68
MRKNFINIFFALGVIIVQTSCKKFLEPLPDNRAELNNEDKIAKMLVSAYPSGNYIVAAEWASDNTDDIENLKPYSQRFSDEIFNWQPSTVVSNNDGLDRLWSQSYISIASANAVLQAIQESANPESLNAQKGEALIARAYNHFILVNMFSQAYSKKYSETDLGITYMTKGETTLNPSYQRNSVKEVYDFIVKDLEEGIPLIDDAAYANSSVAKYHFNKNAAYTFAARVHLFMENWQKAEEYASLALGANPSAYNRNNSYIASFGTTWGNVTREYNASSDKANFLLAAPVSSGGTEMGPYTPSSPGVGVSNRYGYSWMIGYTEGAFARPPFYDQPIASLPAADTRYRIRSFRYDSSTLHKFLFPRVSYQFEYTDPVARIGYSRCVWGPLTSEEALLIRAEANVHLKNYTEALADMQLWTTNTVTLTYTLTEANINEWANSFAYYTPEQPTPKKKFNADFIIEPGTQESMLHAILYMRRHQFQGQGMRWFDVKRYGIEIYRRTVRGRETVVSVNDKLEIRDKRRAFQLPQDVIDAGLTPNPR